MSNKIIAMIGAGKMANILSRYFAKAGYHVHIGARDPEKARQLARKLGDSVQGDSIAEAIQHSDIVFLAVLYLQIPDTVKLTGPLSGKIVVDISNPFKPDFSGLLIGTDTSAVEELARMLPEANVVKAFNTVFAAVLERGPEYDSHRAQILYAGDDPTAKQEVSELIKAMGFTTVDAGQLISARFLEPLSALVIQTDKHLKHPVQITPVMLERPSTL